MTEVGANDPVAAKCATEIAHRALAGRYDPLLACRDLADLRKQLPRVTDAIMDRFVGVASEVDDLPIGVERKHWAPEALRAKDVEAADYRELVRHRVGTALQELLKALGDNETPRNSIFRF